MANLRTGSCCLETPSCHSLRHRNNETLCPSQLTLLYTACIVLTPSGVSRSSTTAKDSSTAETLTTDPIGPHHKWALLSWFAYQNKLQIKPGDKVTHQSGPPVRLAITVLVLLQRVQIGGSPPKNSTAATGTDSKYGQSPRSEHCARRSISLFHGTVIYETSGISRSNLRTLTELHTCSPSRYSTHAS